VCRLYGVDDDQIDETTNPELHALVAKFWCIGEAETYALFDAVERAWNGSIDRCATIADVANAVGIRLKP
jgi:hypothetical protein